MPALAELSPGLTTTGNAKLSYKWWMGRDNSVLGLGAGAACYKIDMSANATAAINNMTVSTNGTYRDDAVEPLLEIALRYSVNPELRLFAKVQSAEPIGLRQS